MLKPLPLLVVSLFAFHSYGQKTDTIVLFYKPDQFSISKHDKLKLDSFLLKDWDRIAINGYTDETEEEEYNLELSKKRAEEVFQYSLRKNIDGQRMSFLYFGETMPRADNGSDKGRALNRRTEIIGYSYPKVKLKRLTAPVEDPMKPVTRTLDNGLIITYRPGTLPDYIADNFDAGSGTNFQVITNTQQMRQNNMFNNTTRGEILSSVVILCGDRMNPCKLDEPVLVKVPIPFRTNCPIEKVKFFTTVFENGKRIWKEQTKLLYPEEIDGKKYVGIWMDDFCECINFDFKIDPDCYETDSTKILYVNANVKNLSAELKDMNSVYLPRKINDSTHSIVFIKNRLADALISFSLFNGKKRIRGYMNQPVTGLPYDEATGQYLITTGTQKLYFPGLDVWYVSLKVNGDRYRVADDKNKYDFTYLKKNNEKILVDFMVIGKKGRYMQYKDLPLESIPFDKIRGYRVVDKNFLKVLKEKTELAGVRRGGRWAIPEISLNRLIRY